YKLSAVIFSIASIFIFVKILSGASQNQKSQLVKLVFWNPLFVLEIAGAGHNDIIMIFFLLVSIWAWQKQKWLLAGVAIALSMQTKLITIVFFGFACWYLLQRRRYAALLTFTASFAL